MKVSVALLAAALVMTAGLAGCSGKKASGDVSAAAAAAAPVLFLNVTVGNHTYPYTSAHAVPIKPSGVTMATPSSGAPGNATASHSASNSSAAMGNMTHGNMTMGMDNASAPSGHAPLNVSVAFRASGIAAGKALSWMFDFGDGNVTGTLANATPTASAASSAASSASSSANQTTGNHTAGNHTAGAAAGATTKLPGMLDHTFTAVGTHNMTLTLRVAGLAPVTLTAPITVTAAMAMNATNATAYGPPPDPITLTGTITGVEGEPGDDTQTFDLKVPVKTMTLTMVFDDTTGQGAPDLDWSIKGPGGETGGGSNSGNEDPAVFAKPTLGTWTITITPFVAVETDYTITATFA